MVAMDRFSISVWCEMCMSSIHIMSMEFQPLHLSFIQWADDWAAHLQFLYSTYVITSKSILCACTLPTDEFVHHILYMHNEL